MYLLAFMLRRLVLVVVVLLLVSMLTFGIVNILPGDVANAILGDMGTPDQIAALRERLGLNLPLAARYVTWLTHLLSGDFGTSLQHDRPIGPMLAGRLGNSAILGGIAMAIAVPLATALGVVSAVNRGGWADRAISSFTLVNFALPEYVVGIVLILVFSIWWPILPGSSLMDPAADPLARPSALVLPATVLVLGMLTYISQVTRTRMIEVLDSAYIRTATLKGLPGWLVVLKHGLPNVLPATLVEIGMNLGYVLGGLVVIETLFSYAGLGQMIVNAVAYRDVPVIEAAVLLVATGYCLGNLIADMGAAAFNPRLRA
jgi:peptide/nickel transport system permease protein